MTETAPSAPAEAQDQKLMIIAICRGQDGQIVITPLDVEHDTDDQSPMTEDQIKARILLDQVFRSTQEDMMKALGSLYEMFAHRLYRSHFRTFENFCFAMYGAHRVNDALMKKVKERTKALEAECKEGL